MRAPFDAEERDLLDRLLQHGTEVRARARAGARGGRTAGFRAAVPRVGRRFDRLPPSDGGVPAYRLNHEEVIKALEEGISFIEGFEPQEAIADEKGHLQSVRFRRTARTGDIIELPARSCLVAAGTTPNITYEKEWPGTFRMDERKRFFLPHRAVPDGSGGWRLEPAAADDQSAFFTGYERQGRFISFFGDNHPAYNGNVVKAMASAKYGYRPVTDVVGEAGARPGPRRGPARAGMGSASAAAMAELLTAHVHEVRRLTPTIVEVVVHAPAAARKFPAGAVLPAAELRGARGERRGLASPHRAARPDRGRGWTPEKGLLSMIALELGGSSRLCSSLRSRASRSW